MKQMGMARWLVAIGVLAGLTAAVFFYWFFPQIVLEFGKTYPEFQRLVFPCLAIFYTASLPFFFGLLQYFLICSRIFRDRSFCRQNARALSLISYCALADTLLCLCLTVLLAINNALNAGVLILSAGVTAAGIFAAVLSLAISHLVRKASEMQEENDLTI